MLTLIFCPVVFPIKTHISRSRLPHNWVPSLVSFFFDHSKGNNLMNSRGKFVPLGLVIYLRRSPTCKNMKIPIVQNFVSSFYLLCFSFVICLHGCFSSVLRVLSMSSSESMLLRERDCAVYKSHAHYYLPCNSTLFISQKNIKYTQIAHYICT